MQDQYSRTQLLLGKEAMEKLHNSRVAVFGLSLIHISAALNADTMTDDQLHAALQVGIKEIQNGDTVDAASAFAQFREQHR